MLSDQRTAVATCAAQYAGSTAASAFIHAPVPLHASGTAGGRSSMACSFSRSTRWTDAIIGVWYARLIGSLRALTPSAFSSASSALTASGSPAITCRLGAFATASHSLSGRAATSAAARSASTGHMSIAPSGAASDRLARAAISESASASDSTPHSVAATNSPIEWPPIAAGRTPSSSSVRPRASSVTKMAGCVTVGVSKRARKPSAASASALG
mmetsp:Transcript_41874/g.111060  ORF Transcript_41874/g.111060 Transcript_41874/m.111060 type:complete len:214 (+) Transcript_41874:438-1079(+)